jgi:hypothetical protein
VCCSLYPQFSNHTFNISSHEVPILYRRYFNYKTKFSILLKLRPKYLVWVGRNCSQRNIFKFLKYKYKWNIIFPVLYGCAVCYLRLKDAISEVLDNFMLRKTFRSKTEDVTRGWRKLHSEEFHDLLLFNVLSSNTPPFIVCVNKATCFDPSQRPSSGIKCVFKTKTFT